MLRHGVYFGLARYDQADAAFAALRAMPGAGPARIAEATGRQCIALANRGRYEEATLLTRACAQELGLPHPADDAWDAALAAEVDAFYAAPAARGPRLFDELEPVDDPALEQLYGQLRNATDTTAITSILSTGATSASPAR